MYKGLAHRNWLKFLFWQFAQKQGGLQRKILVHCAYICYFCNP